MLSLSPSLLLSFFEQRGKKHGFKANKTESNQMKTSHRQKNLKWMLLIKEKKIRRTKNQEFPQKPSHFQKASLSFPMKNNV